MASSEALKNAIQMWMNMNLLPRADYEQALKENPDMTISEFFERLLTDAEVSDGKHMG